MPDDEDTDVGGEGIRQLTRQEEAEMVPLSAVVQARLDGACLQLDSFDCDAGDLEWRGALVVRTFEVCDSFQVGPQASAGGSQSFAGWSELRRMLGFHASTHRVRAPGDGMVQCIVEGIRAEPGAGPILLEWCVQAVGESR